MSVQLHAAALIAVGDELLRGAHPDLDSPQAAGMLSLAEWRVLHVQVVPDQEAEIAAAVERALGVAQLVLVSGGLGPTLDDVTRHGVARAVGAELEHSDEAWENVLGFYREWRKDPPDANRRQALVPRGARVLKNAHGTAPGFALSARGTTIMVLPGPPREFAGMLRDHVAGWLEEQTERELVVRRAELYTIGLSESVFADKVGEWMARDAEPRIGVTAKEGVLGVHLVSHAASAQEAELLLSTRVAELRSRIGAYVFSDRQGDPARALVERLLERGLTFTTAESCTAGLLAGALARAPGASAALEQAFVTYANDAKTELLGVPGEELERSGAVSRAVVEAMACGAAQRAGADLALAVSGIAGPGGGSEEKPVGLVWIAAALRRDERTEAAGSPFEVVSEERRFGDLGREYVRRRAVQAAVELGLRVVGAGQDS